MCPNIGVVGPFSKPFPIRGKGWAVVRSFWTGSEEAE